MARAIDQGVAERVGRRRIAGTIRHQLAQVGDRFIHLVSGFELENAREAQLHGIRIRLQSRVQQRQCANFVATTAEQ
jgi:hypothetical protein